MLACPEHLLESGEVIRYPCCPSPCAFAAVSDGKSAAGHPSLSVRLLRGSVHVLCCQSGSHLAMVVSEVISVENPSMFLGGAAQSRRGDKGTARSSSFRTSVQEMGAYWVTAFGGEGGMALRR